MKITLATVKTFIRKNRKDLHINVRSSFDGMTDGLESRNRGFVPAGSEPDYVQTLGVPGAWFVRGSRDRFTEYDDGKFVGIQVHNSCGAFVIAVTKQKTKN